MNNDCILCVYTNIYGGPGGPVIIRRFALSLKICPSIVRIFPWVMNMIDLPTRISVRIIISNSNNDNDEHNNHNNARSGPSPRGACSGTRETTAAAWLWRSELVRLVIL